MIPFRWTPGSWGLKGDAYKRAKAEYELTGEKLDYALNDIDNSGNAHKLKEYELNLKYGYMNQYDYDLAVVNIQYEGKDYSKKILEIDLKHNKITKADYQKELANIEERSWVTGTLKKDENGYYFDLDWNDFFIDELKAKGYAGFSDEEIVDKWIGTLYANEIYSEIYRMENTDNVPYNVKRNETGDGKASYS